MKEQSYQPIIPFTVRYPSLAAISLHQLEVDIG